MSRIRRAPSPERTSDYERRFISAMIRSRHDKRITQQDLSDLLAEAGMHCTPDILFNIEGGKRNIKLYEAHEIARILGFDLGTLQREAVTVDGLALALAATARGWAAAELGATAGDV